MNQLLLLLSSIIINYYQKHKSFSFNETIHVCETVAQRTASYIMFAFTLCTEWLKIFTVVQTVFSTSL